MEELRVARLLSSVENDSLVEVMQRFESVSSMSPEVMQNVQSTAVRCNRIDVLNELHKRGVVFTSHCLMMTICENNISAAKLVMQSVHPEDVHYRLAQMLNRKDFLVLFSLGYIPKRGMLSRLLGLFGKNKDVEL